MNKLELRVKEIIEENGGQEFADQVLEHGCASGIVPELIYYSQTHEWFDTYYEEIMELVEQFEEMTGEKLEIGGDLKNNLAWWSFEEVTLNLSCN